MLSQLNIGSVNQTLSVTSDHQLQYGYTTNLRDSSGNLLTTVFGGKLGAGSGLNTVDADNNSTFTTKDWVTDQINGVTLYEWIDELEFTSTSGTATMYLTYTPSAQAPSSAVVVQVEINGIPVRPEALTLYGTTLTINTTSGTYNIGFELDSTDYVVARYVYKPDASSVSPVAVQNVVTLTASGDFTIVGPKTILIVDKTVPQATNVYLPVGQYNAVVVVKDGAGNSDSYNITVYPSTSDTGATIDGAASFVINGEYNAYTFCWAGTYWALI